MLTKKQRMMGIRYIIKGTCKGVPDCTKDICPLYLCGIYNNSNERMYVMKRLIGNYSEEEVFEALL